MAKKGIHARCIPACMCNPGNITTLNTSAYYYRVPTAPPILPYALPHMPSRELACRNTNDAACSVVTESCIFFKQIAYRGVGRHCRGLVSQPGTMGAQCRRMHLWCCQARGIVRVDEGRWKGCDEARDTVNKWWKTIWHMSTAVWTRQVHILRDSRGKGRGR